MNLDSTSFKKRLATDNLLNEPILKKQNIDIKETIKGFNMIMDGEVDEYPEAAFNLVGTIDDAIEKGKKLVAAAKN